MPGEFYIEDQKLRSDITDIKNSVTQVTTNITTLVTKAQGGTPLTGSAVGNWQAGEADVVSIGADGVRNKIPSEARRLQPESQIHIFEIGKKPFVVTTGGFDRAFAIKSRATACRENLHLAMVFSPVFLLLPAPITQPRAQEAVAGAIKNLSFLEIENPARQKSRLRMAVNGVNALG